ncbi:hypothetical protein [Kiloniella laminariae]|uniref:Uncharacterized protein n=1 Tax=Kiloniella laminariae TaxID=454162 RepID=A0ABT4LNH2_9PROT|nr:hypothetical protein [Kiloniella laminariae]MCZ4282606.1 hypothetical protein [Kiloniella laminariae]
MNINAPSFQSTVRFSEPAAAITTAQEDAARRNSQAAVETKRPVENADPSNEARKFKADENRGQNLDIQV